MTAGIPEPREKSLVYIIDDQATSRIIMENIARTIDENIVVRSFDNATDALRDAETDKPDLILTDYQMPVMDGVEFIEKIRMSGASKDVPIVIITALEDKDALYRALEAGATDFLVKPVDIHECQVRCRNLLTMQRQRQIISNHARSLEKEVREATRQVQLRAHHPAQYLRRTGRQLLRPGERPTRL